MYKNFGNLFWSNNFFFKKSHPRVLVDYLQIGSLTFCYQRDLLNLSIQESLSLVEDLSIEFSRKINYLNLRIANLKSLD